MLLRLLHSIQDILRWLSLDKFMLQDLLVGAIEVLDPEAVYFIFATLK